MYIQVGGYRKPKGKDQVSKVRFDVIDKENFGWLSKHKWSAHNKGYAYCWYHGECLLMHREIALKHSIIKNNEHVDHIDGNKTNNRVSNLRKATITENNRNRGKSSQNTGLYKGVTKSYNKGKPYKAAIWVDSKRIHLGCFRTELEAALVYDTAAIKYHKEFAVTNF